ncbi:hypothetical protein [Bacteriovorax sp. BSW11_IV]|uniref:hypothetical protein n=1 Tax=Bacteriovorax sp. BSW11_IV TaxID=1353529 RepID=UPI000550E9ED|nr:hypothetical protein [Bacteriovorax sp. BSW11_IV]
MNALLNVLIFLSPILIMTLVLSVMAKLMPKSKSEIKRSELSPFKYKTAYNTVFSLKFSSLMRDFLVLALWFCFSLYFVYIKDLQITPAMGGCILMLPVFYLLKNLKSR